MPERGGVGELTRRWAPEAALVVLAGAVFLGCLGAVDLWGKREQRAAAETIDTLRQGHWLVAEIQGRPRLEKPPLPRWTVATLMAITGRQNEWVVRLPSALGALGMVGLVYALGRRLGGRAVGLAAGYALSTSVFFIAELRQAGNDGLLAFFTTLALYAAWRRLHGGEQPEGAPRAPAEPVGSRGWAILMHAALGLGFLTKGPIILVLVALAVLPYLAAAGCLRRGARALAEPFGMALFLVLALCWPVPVLLGRPEALGVWRLEMGQKAGTAGIAHHRDRPILALEWFWMTAPWSIVATLAAGALPWRRREYQAEPWRWFVWSWAVVNLLMFCFWTVAKPNYYLPCMPGVALLVGLEWVRLCRAARGSSAGASHARRFLQGHWAIFLSLAAVAPIIASRIAPDLIVAVSVCAAAVAAGSVGSAVLWRRGADATTLAPIVAALAVLVIVGYGIIAPTRDARHSHRALAETLHGLLPPETRTVMFFHELDEGLWFYLDESRTLRPVPGSTPRYNDGYDMLREYWNNTLVADPRARLRLQMEILRDWADEPAEARESPYVLIRADRYDAFAPDVADRLQVVYREADLERNELVLLRVLDEPPTPASSTAETPPRASSGPVATAPEDDSPRR